MTHQTNDWEKKLENELFTMGMWHDSPAGYYRRLDALKDFIRTLLLTSHTYKKWVDGD